MNFHMADNTPMSPGEYDADFPAHAPQPVPDSADSAGSFGAVPHTETQANGTGAALPPRVQQRKAPRPRSSAAWWEAPYVFFVTFIIFALITPRLITFL